MKQFDRIPLKGTAFPVMSTILLLQRSPQVAQRLQELISPSPGLTVIGVAETIAQARRSLAQEVPDLLIADLRLTDGPVTTLLRELRGDGYYGNPQCLMLAMSIEDPLLLEAMRVGADSYFMQGRASAALLAAISLVLCGESAMSRTIARQVLAHFGPDGGRRAPTIDGFGVPHRQQLTDAEQRMLEGIADGQTLHQVAQSLQLTPHGAGVRLRGIYRKLQADLRGAALTLLAA